MKIYKIAAPLPLDTIPVERGETQVDNLLTDNMIRELDRKYHFKKYLGSGMWGVAFLTRDGKVVKITTDHNEYLSALDLIGDGWQRTAPFATIHEAYQLDDGIFVIIKDKIKVLTENERNIFDTFISEFGGDIDKVPKEDVDFYGVSLLNEFADYVINIQNYTQYEDTLNSSNIGRNSDGELVTFDPRQSSFDFK